MITRLPPYAACSAGGFKQSANKICPVHHVLTAAAAPVLSNSTSMLCMTQPLAALKEITLQGMRNQTSTLRAALRLARWPAIRPK